MKKSELMQILAEYEYNYEVKIVVSSPEFDVEDGDILEIADARSIVFDPSLDAITITGDYEGE